MPTGSTVPGYWLAIAASDEARGCGSFSRIRAERALLRRRVLAIACCGISAHFKDDGTVLRRLPHQLTGNVAQAIDIVWRKHEAGRQIHRVFALLHVADRSVNQMKAELMSGEISSAISPLPDLLELHRAGSVRILATPGKTRSRQTMDVPTFREQGFPSIEAVGWYGLFVTAGSTPSTIDRVSRLIVSALAQAEVRERLAALGVEPTGTTPYAFPATVAADTARWKRLVMQFKLKID